MGKGKKFHVDPGEKDFDPFEIPWIRIFPKEVSYLMTYHESCGHVLPHPHDHSWLKSFGLSFGLGGLFNNRKNSMMMAHRFNGDSGMMDVTIYGHIHSETIKGPDGTDQAIDSVNLEQPIFCNLRLDRYHKKFILTTQAEGSDPRSGSIQMDPLTMSILWHSKDLGLWHGGQIPAVQYHEITKQRVKGTPPSFVTF